jgi:hypothetical protein
LETFLSSREVIILSCSNNNLKIYYHALQPKPLNYNNYYNNNNNNNNTNNAKINISEYLGKNNLSSIEIEPNNNNDNSIIPYNDDISLYHTNVSEKELDFDTPLLDNFINFDKNNINNNIPKKYKKVRFNFFKFSSGRPPKIYINSIPIEDDVNVD